MVLLLLLSFLSTYLVLRGYICYAESNNITAPDVHKPGKPQVADKGGHISPLLLLLLFLPPLFKGGLRVNLKIPLAIFSSGSIGFLVGFIDDHKSLGLIKIPLMLLGGLPLIVLGTYSPCPYFPLLGGTRLTILYPYFLCVIVTVISNGTNMIDVVNGSALTQSFFSVLTVIFWSTVLLIFGSFGSASELMYLRYSLPILGILLGFLALNKYPAQIFLGNSGAYALGATVSALIIVTRKEFVAMISLLPMILNAFIILISLGGVKTKESFPSPVKIKEGLIYPNEEEGSPITLVGLRASVNPVRERGVIRFFNLLFLLAFLFSFVTGMIIYFPKFFFFCSPPLGTLVTCVP